MKTSFGHAIWFAAFLAIVPISNSSLAQNKVVVIPMFEEVTAEHWQGSWELTEDYQPGDIVEYSGSSHIARVAIVSGNLPPDSNADWDLVAESGMDGATGPQGPQGIPGPQGDMGHEGPIGPVGPTGPQGETGSGILYQGSATVAEMSSWDPLSLTSNHTWVLLDSGQVSIGLQTINVVAGDSLIWTEGDQFVNAGQIQGPPGEDGFDPYISDGSDGHVAGNWVDETGDTGVAATGLQGLPGIQGDTGLTGLPGIPGIQGAPGDTGSQGVPGDPGPAGTDGEDGFDPYISDGSDGHVAGNWVDETGDTGVPATGPQGLQGPSGIQGDTGLPGIPGIPGIQGAPGDTGSQGIPGDPGPTGADGAQGPAGPQGPAGADAPQPANIIWVATSGGDFSDPVTAINSISASTSSRFLINIAPGIYTLSGPLVMQEYVDIRGSGRNTTILTQGISHSIPDSNAALVIGNDNASLRDLTVENTGSGNFSIGIYNSDASLNISGVSIVVSGNNIGQYGIFNTGFSSPRISDVSISVFGGGDHYGVYNDEGLLAATSTAFAIIRNSDISASTNSVFASTGSGSSETYISDSMLDGVIGGNPKCSFVFMADGSGLTGNCQPQP